MVQLRISSAEDFEKFTEKAKEIKGLRGQELAQKLADLSGVHADTLLLVALAQRRVVQLAEEGDKEALEIIEAEQKRVEEEIKQDLKNLALLAAPTDGKAH